MSDDANGLSGIAIIGMAGRFPRAKNLSELWRNVRDGVDCVSYFQEDELDPAPPPELLRDPSYVKARGVLEDADLFDARFFDIPPRQAELMDPQNRLFLETAWHALEDAGYDPGRVNGTVGLFGGVTFSSYFLNNLLSNPDLLAAVGGYQVALGTDRDYLTTLVSYKLDLKGPSINVQTACSTSLVAVVLACQSLLAYGCDMALAGGVSVKVPQKTGYLYKPGGLDSAQGRCRAFDAAADGSVYGGGVGVVVLKRLEDALADGDAIYGVILGSAVNNDGAARVGFTAPGVEGQAEAIAQAQALAGVDPATIGYVECHGTGTALGDPIEVAALSKAFRAGAQGDLPRGFCALGSIKTNIGHCSAAAGVAGLIKATLALAHRQIPPTLHFETPNPAIGIETTPFRVSTHLADWETDGTPRRAGVSSFGLGGTNAHVVLEEAPEPGPSGPSRPWQLLLLSARSETALETATDNLAEDLGAHPERPLADVAFTLEVGRRAFAHRRVLVCRNTEDAREALARRDPRRLLSDVREGGNRPVAFLFPGVGDHYAGMARNLYETEPTFREELDRCCEILAPRLGRDLRPLILAERSSGSAGPDLRRLLGRGEPEPSERPLDRTLYAQPAVFAVEYALARLLFEWGLRPEALLGYSLGEYVAACLAGVMSLEDALALVAERSRLIDGLAPGAMLAVPLPEERVRSLVAGSGLDLAAVNGPAVCVIAGPVGAVEALRERLAGEGVPSRRLPTTHAFHSHRMEPVAPALSRLARGLRLQAPKIPYVSNVTGTWITAKEATDPEYWARHLCQPVRFGDGLAALWQNPDRVLLEVGPGFGLSTLALQLPAEEGAGRIALPSLPNEHDPQPDDAFLLGTLGKLWLSGVEIDWSGFHTHEQRRRVRLPLYPFERVRYWVEPRRQPIPESQPSLPSLQSLQSLQSLSPRPRLRNAWVPPETATEKAIAGLFGELLGIEGVGLHDSFFELGGHSLLGTSLLSRLRALYGVELPLRVLFEEPTVAGLAAHVAEGPDVSAAPPLVPVPRDRDLPLSFAQQRLWFLDRLMQGNPFYNLSGGVRLTGPLDVEALRRSLREVVQRHETLRTGFAEVEGSPAQRIVPDLTLEIPVLDLSDLPSEVRRIARDQARAPFDLTRPGLLRVALLRLGEGEHVLLWAIHHIVSDAWSNAVLMGEVAALYAGQPLPELPVQYADFAVWQREWLSGETLERQLAYWRERLAGAPVVELPTDRPRPPVQTFRGATYRVTYGKPLLDGLTALARQRDASLFMALLAAFDVLLCRFTGQEDVAVGSPVANRTRPELERLIGFFVNTLVLRIDSAGDPAFPDLLARVKEVALGAFAHQDLPFEQLVEELQPRRDLSRNPLFQVMFNLLNAPPARMEVAGGLEMGILPGGEGAALFDLQAYVTETPEGLRIAWEHNTDLFNRATIERLSRSFETLLSGIVASPEARLWELPLLTEEERTQLLVRWNDTAVPVPGPGTIHALFEAQVERTPEAVALVFEGETLTYAELNARANRAAHHLRSLGAGPGVLVALRFERSVPAVLAVLAVLKAGGAYLPLDPSHPAERLAFLLEDSQAALVLTEIEEKGDSSNPVPLAGPGHLAYVIYTSGSTGRPKGVSVTHGAVANFLASMAREPGMTADDVLLAVTTLSFDIAGLELLLPLTVGARVVLASRETALDGARLASALKDHGVTVLQATPATWRLLLAAGWEGDRGLTALCGGEALPRDLARDLLPRVGALWNVYGPTETTVWSSIERVTEADAISVGLPIANTVIHLLDRRMEPVPLGVPGDLYIGGTGLARGYLGRPDLTAERFVPDPFSSGERLYRTGDLARRRASGEIELLGRADHQVKIRGFRVEPGEIEAVLAEDPAVREAVVALREDVPGDQRLVAYIVGDGDPVRLRSLLASRLPAYMIPSAFVALEALPLTPSGKVDRRALPRPSADQVEEAFVPPRTPTEAALAGIWEDVLGVERAGVHSDFFELGGHSLLATQVVARVRARFGVELPLAVLFRETALGSLARAVDARLASGEAGEPAVEIHRISRDGEIPLSFAQQRLWFLDRLMPGHPFYNLSGGVRLTGPLDVQALRCSLGEVVRRHETLRTGFAEVDGRPVQRIVPDLALEISVLDLSDLSSEEREAAVRRIAGERAREPFDLARPGLLRVTLLRLRGGEHVLLWTIHHIVSDAWSNAVLMGEVAALYAGKPLPELPVQYADFAVWQRQWLSGETLDRQLAYWRERLAGAPVVELPTDRPRPPVQTFRGATHRVTYGKPLQDDLAALARQRDSSPFMALLAAFDALLCRFTGQEDVVVGSPIANRTRPEVERLIGFFVNTLVLRTDASGDPAFTVLLDRARETALGAFAHQDLPFEQLVEELQPRRDLSRNPLFQVMLNLLNAPPPRVEVSGDLEMSALPAGDGAALFDLQAYVTESPEGLRVAWEHNTDLFDRETIERLSRSFEALLSGIVASPETRLWDLPLLTEKERGQLIVRWNETLAPVPEPGTIHALFEAQVERTPDAVALVFEGESLTYAGLNVRANRAAHHLRTLGVAPETLVALRLERSVPAIVAVLAVLKAGGAYLPLDLTQPAERLAFLLEDSGAALVLTGLEEADNATNPEPLAGPGNLAYVLYTSGSTGRPKGVSVTHGSVANFLASAARWPGLGPDDAVLAVTTLSFDIAGYELLLPLTVGARIVLVTREAALDGKRLAAVLSAERVTRMQVTPATWRLLLGSGWSGEPGLMALSGGEALPRDLARELLPRAGSLWNFYGPTEATIWSSVQKVAESEGPIPIGLPIANTEIHLLDRRLEPVPLGVSGELYIGGAGLARGYLHRPDLTAEHFLPDPFSVGKRLYRTGDLARRLPGGEIDFLGRADHQVKIRGFRVEPGEIEAVLAEDPAVRQAVVVLREDAPGDPRLVAYVVREEPGDGARLRDLLAARLPAYMIPSAFVDLEALPLTPSGKVDRRALPAPGTERGDRAWAEPETETERRLAGIWSALLRLDRVGRVDDFFELGGHSLLATQLVARVRDAFGVELPLPAVFRETTLAALAARIDHEAVEAAPPLPPLPRLERRGRTVAPLSYTQRGLWFLDRMEPGSPTYILASALRLTGRLDIAAFTRSFEEVVARHEALRATFAERDGDPVQILAPALALSIPRVDLRAIPEAAREAETRRLGRQEALRPFDLAAGPLLRVTLLRLGDEEHVALFALHHIAADAWSVGVLVGEVAALYAAFVRGLPSPLLPLPLQYPDWVEWQRELLEGPARDAQLAWWTERLAGAPPLDLPADRPRPAVQTTRVAALQASASGDLGARGGVTPFMVLLAAFETLLSRIAGQDDFVVGIPIANRRSSELEQLIGLFINTLALRADVAGSPTFAELLARVRETTVEAYAHQDLPLEVILRALALERDLSRAPLFQVLFQVQNAPAAAAFELPELTLAPVELGVAQAADYDLVVTYIETPQGLSGTWVYNTDLFDRSTAARLARSFHTLLAVAVADPSRSLASLPLLPESERWQVLGEWNGTPAPGLPEGAGELRRLFEIQAARVPEAPALAWEEGSLSYGDLNRRANRLAHGLRKLGVGPEVLVGLLVERSPAMIVGMLGVLKAGGAYLPLDPSYPAERLDLMLGDAGAALVLTEARIDDPDWTAGESEEDPQDGTGPGFPAYVIYTSGSTGTPKGVVALNRGLASFTRAMAGVLKLGPGDCFLEFPSFSFDASLVSIAATLASGAALVLHRDPTGLSIDELLAFCAAQRVTHLDIPVAFLRQIVQELAARGDRGFGGAPVRALLTGGESLSREALLQWADLVGRDEDSLFLSSYGPTETTVTASVFTITARKAAGLARGNVPLGRPLPGVTVLVLDGELSPVPVGVPGEVWIGGTGVTRGYLRRPGLTADAFRPDPLGGAGERIYRTGDRARWLPDGHLEFLGRADHQVKVRGFRIELGEIEAALARHPAVEHAVVVAMGDGGERRLVAYAVPAGNAPEGLARDLRAFLRESLPEAMVPSAVVLLDKLPVTPGGKVDRRALPRPDLSEAPGRSYAPPRGEIAETLAVVWARLLGVDRVGADDDFFDLGGHSLLATQLVSRIREVFGVELPLRRLFETPTLQALASAVEAARSEERGMAAPPVVPVPRDGDLPLSFAQERLWFLDQLQPGQATYNMPSAVRMSGPLAPAALARAFARVVRRHEALRTTFPAVAGHPVQRIAPPAPFPLPVVDLGALPAGEREREAARLTALEAARPFDLANGPLLRAGLLRMGEGEHLLLATLHHIISDGWSMGILIRELGAAYQSLSLPGLPVQYADWAVWQRQWLEGDVLEAQLGYWRRQLGGDVAVLELPADRPRPAVAAFRGDHRSTILPAGLAQSLEALARREEATLFMTLLAAFDVLLSRLTNQTDIPVGTPVAGRSRGEVEGLIGLFLNTLVLREDLSGDPAFRDLLARLRGTALDAFAHQDLPFERLVEDLQPRRTLNQTPLFQVMLVLQNAPGGELGAGDLTLAPVATAAPAARFDLTLVLWTAADGLHASAEYRSDLFEGATVERWLGHFQTLLEGIVADPGRRISELPLLTPAEREQIVSAWNDTAEDFGPPACLHDLFYEQAARTPDAPAILWKEGETTYGNLARQADRLARHLRAKGVGPGDLVALLLDPSPERVAAVLAVLRAGAAYVPLDPAYPADRLEFMMADTGAALLLTREALAAALEEPDEGEPVDLPAAAPDDRAYVIYTSGSTGLPKGVVIRHAAAVNTVRDVNRRFGVGREDRVFAVSALSFDLSVYDLFGPLAVGGAAVLPEPSAIPDPTAWSAALIRHGVTIWDSAPALMDLLVSSGAPLPETLRLVLLSGDWIPVTLPGEIRRRVPGARVISLGGATEASIWSILYPIPDVPPSWTSIPYGRPMANQAFHVLDPAGHPAPVGIAGELHIGGIGVADGYHARPELTAEKFVPDPFADCPGARLYRTGDLGRRFADGTIEFLGRRDHQVKIRGFRIELGEIEAVLNAHPAVRESVVLARQEEGLAKSAGLSQARLVAYIVPEPGADLDLAALRNHLAACLPEHMVPSALVPLESIPLNSNGKVDRRALPAPEAGPEREAGFVTPRDGVEETIAALWKDLLKVERVGAHDNFFALGGHSLLATRVAAALRDAFRVEVPLRTLFEKPTVADLALAVAQLRLEQAGTTEAARLLDTLEGLSDEEVEALLAGEEGELEEV